MRDRYRVLYRGGEGETVEKKSRFIATIRPVESEEEAAAFNTGMHHTTVLHLRWERTMR